MSRRKNPEPQATQVRKTASELMEERWVREVKRARLRWLTIGPAVVIAIALIVVSIVGYTSAWPQRMQASDAGVVNDETYSMVIADSVNDTVGVRGSIFLFAGSITSISQESLRMGYTSPSGNSYIINVPISRVVFKQDPNAVPEASFHFRYWEEYTSAAFQNNIDRNLGSISVSLTPDQFEQLVNSSGATVPEESTEEQ